MVPNLKLGFWLSGLLICRKNQIQFTEQVNIAKQYITNMLDYDFAYNTFGSSNPERSKYSFRGIIKAAKLAVYNERKTTANKAHILFMNLKI